MYSQHDLYHFVLISAWLAMSLCLPMAAQETPSSAPDEAPMVLKITTREVVIDVVARDWNTNKPVTDLGEKDFQVFELGNRKEKNPHRILYLRAIDPHRDASHAGSADSGFRISSGAICALNSTTHYELAIQASPEPGFHEILVKSRHLMVSLSYRHRYYVGPTRDDSHHAEHINAADSAALGEAACFHPLIPPTLAITAHPLSSPGAKTAKYAVTVRPESLAGIGLDGSNTLVQLDFGMCTFDATGELVRYLHYSTDRQLNAAQLERVQSQGLVNLLEIPGEAPPLARFVVRDRETGNLGTVDASLPVSLAAQSEKAAALLRPEGSIRSFGAVTPRDNAFCGDVYELSTGTAELPDFWNFEPVGSIYTDMLKVENQDITVAGGIPGVTRNNTWFGVDYYGEFFITKPGEYGFELQSDDGSRLEIDNRQVIDNDGVHPALVKAGPVKLSAGRHSIHVPYFQGPPSSLALVLRIKPPDEAWRPFNLNEYAEPRATP